MLTALLSVLSMQYGVSQAGTLKADTTTKPQTEIVQQ